MRCFHISRANNPDNDSTRATIENVVRENFGKLLALLIHRFADMELCEETLQESILVALNKWPDDGIPDNPPAWLMQIAKRKMIDRLRRQQNFAQKSQELLVLANIERETRDIDDDLDALHLPDERLRLIFTCCHPALSQPVRVALTLKTLCGLSTLQVANAFLVPESTMAQRLLRARRKIKIAGIPYQVPPVHLLNERLSAVLAVIYFIFNEGYFGSTGENLISTELCDEAIHLAELMLRLMPKETEVSGLLALMLFHHSRASARLNPDGELIDLENQDRGFWSNDLIRRGDRLLKAALMKGQPGPYQIQAAISAVHAHTKEFANTDWQQIVLLYHRLETFDPNPVIKLNLAVALSYAENPQTGLSYLDLISNIDRLADYYPYHAARAEMYRRLGQFKEAKHSYRSAVDLCGNQAEKNYLEKKLGQCDGKTK